MVSLIISSCADNACDGDDNDDADGGDGVVDVDCDPEDDVDDCDGDAAAAGVDVDGVVDVDCDPEDDVDDCDVAGVDDVDTATDFGGDTGAGFDCVDDVDTVAVWSLLILTVPPLLNNPSTILISMYLGVGSIVPVVLSFISICNCLVESS